MTEPINPDAAPVANHELIDTVGDSDALSGSFGASGIARAPVGLPTRDRSELSGHLIVLEGTDGSGRSTQIALLTEWLESQGFAVQTMGLRRSFLISRDIDELMAQNAVTRYTLAILYATDLYDQLENRIIPALRSGMVV